MSSKFANASATKGPFSGSFQKTEDSVLLANIPNTSEELSGSPHSIQVLACSTLPPSTCNWSSLKSLFCKNCCLCFANFFITFAFLFSAKLLFLELSNLISSFLCSIYLDMYSSPKQSMRESMTRLSRAKNNPNKWSAFFLT